MQNNHGKNQRKPYKTFKAKGARRTSLDEELARFQDEDDQAARGGDYRRYSGGDKRRATRGRQEPHSRSDRRRGSSTKAAPRRRRRRRLWILPLGLLLILLIAGVVGTVLLWPGYRRFDRAVDKSNQRLDSGAYARLAPDNGLLLTKGTTILVLGVDSKSGEPARSDSIMLLRYDPRQRTVNKLSIPRDTLVTLPKQGQSKINAAIYWGGPALAIRTIHSYTGVPINHVMIVNFEGFPKLIDAVGGVDINVPETLTVYAGPTRRKVVITKGKHHFKGWEALFYARIRQPDDDFHRAARQQQVVQALQKKMAARQNWRRLPRIGERFMAGVDTDLTTNELIELAALQALQKGGTSRVIKGTPAWVNGVSYVMPPPASEKQRLVNEFLNR